MRMRQNSLGLQRAAALLSVVTLLVTVGATDSQAISEDAIQVMAEVALDGSPENLEAAIKAIFDGVSADQAGAAAATVLEASEDASLSARKAVGRALTSVSRSLRSEGQGAGANAVVAAMKAAAADGNRAAIAAYNEIAKKTSPSVSTGADGSGVNTQNVSPATQP